MPLKESFRLQSVTFSAGRQTPAFTYSTLKIWLHSKQNELKWNFELFRLFKWQLLYKKGQTPTDSSHHFDVSMITMQSGLFPQLSPSKKCLVSRLCICWQIIQSQISIWGRGGSFTFSMVPQALQEHVMQVKYQTIDHNYVPAPCSVINCHQGGGTPAERNRLNNNEYFCEYSDRNGRFNSKLCLLWRN